jgi:hypothetical protein
VPLPRVGVRELADLEVLCGVAGYVAPLREAA